MIFYLVLVVIFVTIFYQMVRQGVTIPTIPVLGIPIHDDGLPSIGTKVYYLDDARQKRYGIVIGYYKHQEGTDIHVVNDSGDDAYVKLEMLIGETSVVGANEGDLVKILSDGVLGVVEKLELTPSKTLIYTVVIANREKRVVKEGEFLNLENYDLSTEEKNETRKRIYETKNFHVQSLETEDWRTTLNRALIRARYGRVLTKGFIDEIDEKRRLD